MRTYLTYLLCLRQNIESKAGLLKHFQTHIDLDKKWPWTWWAKFDLSRAHLFTMPVLVGDDLRRWFGVNPCDVNT